MTRHLALLAQAGAGAGAGTTQALVLRRPPRLRAQAAVLAWFSLGVLTSGAFGVGSLFGLKALQADGMPLTWERLAGTVQEGLETTFTAAWARMPTMPLLAPPAVTPPAKQPAVPPKWEVVQLPIERHAGEAPLGLRVTGPDDLPVELVLDGVPSGVRPSRGAPIGPSTWVLGQADLDGLALTYDDTAPAAFDLKIAVIAPRHVATTGSLVQVRLVDGAMAVARAPAVEPQPVRSAAAVPSSSEPEPAIGRVTDRAKRQGPENKSAAAPAPVAPRPAASADTSPAVAEPTTAAARTWPEGAYGLGAVSREPEPPAPPPAWSPFQERAP